MKKLKYFLSIALLLLTAMVMRAQQNTINVGVMLPLHNVDGDGRRMVEYYRGMLMAIDQLRSEGMSINVHAWNVNIDADIRTTLLQDGANECNVIFGPLYTKQVKPLGDFCRTYNIKMVIPFSITGDEVDRNPMIYQVYESNDEMYTKSIKHVSENFAGYHMVFIDCNDTTSRKGPFTFGLRKILEQKGIDYSITNLKNTPETFAKAFSLSKPNLVILNTGRSPELTQALNKLDVLMATNSAVQISMYGYTEWLMYAKYNKERFCKMNVYVPTNFYYNEASAVSQQLAEKYKAQFNQEMQYALPHFAITGYDHAMHFLGNKSSWVQTPLNFVKQGNGGYRNNTFMMIHYMHNGGVEALSY